MRQRASFRTRLVAAMVLVAVAVLALSYATTYVLVRRELQENALESLRSRSASLSDAVASIRTPQLGSGGAAPSAARVTAFVRKIRNAVRVSDMRAVVVDADGTLRTFRNAPVFSLPAPLTVSDLDTARLLTGAEVSGRHGNTVFLTEMVEPISTRRGESGVLALVATDSVQTKVLSRSAPLLLLAGLGVLALAGAVAFWLARRLTRPIREIERAAGQLASGDLSGRADVPPGTDGELTTLGNTLNAMAAQLEQSRGSQRAFLLSISHDLRTPLTSIRGYAEALADGTLDDADPDARTRAATVIGAEARRLERLVRDLLDLSRLDSRQFSLTPRACDATEIVRDAAEAFAPQAHDLGLALRVLPSGSIPAQVDPDRLAQIVANLVENALKYAASTVEVAAALDAGNIAVVVTDDGPGIPAEDLTSVFERLYTVRITPGRSVGTGLGLAIVHELASAMGGHAVAETPPAGGSRFVVSLPTRTPNAAKA